MIIYPPGGFPRNTLRTVRLDELPDDAWRYIVGGPDESTLKDPARLHRVVSWAYRCIDVRSRAIASHPWDLERRGSVIATEQDYVRADVPWLAEFPRLLMLIEAALSLGGAAYLLREQNVTGSRVLSLRWLLPASIDVQIARDGGIMFTRHESAGTSVKLDESELVYLWLPDPAVELGPPKSYPALAALAEMGVLANQQALLSSYFGRGMIKATLLTYDGTMTPGDKVALKRWWRRAMKGIKNAFTTEIVRADIKPISVGEGVGDLDHALTDKEREGIATAFGVPQSKVSVKPGGLGDVTQSDDLMFHTDTVYPQVRWLYSELNRQLLGPLGMQLVPRPERLELIQQVEVSKAQALRDLVDGPVMTPNEARERLGLEPLAGGDELYRPEGVTLIAGRSRVPAERVMPAEHAHAVDEWDAGPFRRWCVARIKRGEPLDVSDFTSSRTVDELEEVAHLVLMQRQDGYRSAADFGLSIRTAVRRFWAGTSDRHGFVDEMVSILNRGYNRAWREGAREVGVQEDELTSDELAEIARYANSHTTHVLSFADQIESGLKGDGKLETHLHRAGIWEARYDEVRIAGKASAARDGKLEWVLGGTKEHCGSCSKLAGRVKRASYWRERGIMPRVAGAGYLACGGWRCECDLKPTDKRMTPGPLPALP